MEEAFRKLQDIENKNIKGTNVSDDGFFTYNCNMPIITHDLELLRVDDNSNIKLYTVPRVGDVLLSIKVNGEYKHAEFFQYDVFGNKKFIIGKAKMYVIHSFMVFHFYK